MSTPFTPAVLIPPGSSSTLLGVTCHPYFRRRRRRSSTAPGAGHYNKSPVEGHQTAASVAQPVAATVGEEKRSRIALEATHQEPVRFWSWWAIKQAVASEVKAWLQEGWRVMLLFPLSSRNFKS
jgi:hypothetical protein